MNRAIDARLQKMERTLGTGPDDKFGLSKLSDDELDRLLHDVLSRIAANVGDLFTPGEVSEASASLANLEAKIWDHVEHNQRPDVAAAIAANNAAGRNGKPWHRDWEALALEWGLLAAAGNHSPRRVPKSKEAGHGQAKSPVLAMCHRDTRKRTLIRRTSARFDT